MLQKCCREVDTASSSRAELRDASSSEFGRVPPSFPFTGLILLLFYSITVK